MLSHGRPTIERCAMIPSFLVSSAGVKLADQTRENSKTAAASTRVSHRRATIELLSLCANMLQHATPLHLSLYMLH